MELSGSQIIIKELIKQKVNLVFEFPGGSICPILDELYRQKTIKTIVFRHEQGAIHAADAYARVTHKPAVCMATSGPGASNLVTGIANAFMDSVPVVVITGQVAVWDIKKNPMVRQRGFQELDIVSVVKSITKAAFLVTDISELALIMEKAFFIANDGRPGPVLVDIPINIQYSLYKYKGTRLKAQKEPVRFSFADNDEVIKRFLSAKRPLVIAGGGVVLSSAQNELISLLKKFELPVVETLMGLTAVPGDYRLNFGLIGYAGSRSANTLVRQADFILGVGLRFDNRAFPEANKEFADGAYLIHVDCDKHELNHRVAVNRAVLSDAKTFLRDFLSALKNKDYEVNYEWMRQACIWRNDFEPQNQSISARLNPRFILSRLSMLLKNSDAVITTDVGQHQLWTAQYFKFAASHSLVTSGGLGTMGFGLPAAIGAKLARPSANVINITSDGSFQMSLHELATLKDNKLPVKIILLNNRCLGLVRQIQEFVFSQRYMSTRMNAQMDFVRISRAFGVDAISVTDELGVEPALKKVVSSRKSILVNFRIKQSENVFPVRIKGKTIYKNAAV